MTDLFKKNDRVLAHGKHLGTVYQDQEEGNVVVHVALDSQPTAVSGYYPHNLEKVPAEHEDYLKGALSVLVFDGPQELFDLLTAGQHKGFTDSGSIRKEDALRSNGAEEKFQFKEGDRVKLKYNRNTGTVARDENPEDDGYVSVRWDTKYDGGVKFEERRDLVVIHAPRATDPANPEQELIDQLEALRLPIKARIERDQAILSKLTAAQKILKKG